jgi:UDP-glucose 4-epimerase
VNVLVVGGSGFIGSHVASAFARLNYPVRSFSRTPPRYGEVGGVEYIFGDALEVDDITPQIADADVVIFAVSTDTPSSAQREPERDLITNAMAAFRVLDAASRHSVQHMVLMSSGGTVYGVPRSLPVPEEHPTNPISAFGISRLTVEKYFRMFCFQTKVPTSILRVGNAYGERQAPDSGQGVIAAFLAALLDDREIEIWGDGSVVRDYVYAGDVAHAFVQATLRPDHNDPDVPTVLNIASGTGTRLLDLLHACAEVVGKTPRISWLPKRSLDVPEIVLDIQSARGALEWEPDTSLEAGLALTAAFLSAHSLPVL